MSALLTTELPGLPTPRRGKVREVYDLGEYLLIVSTDRLSAFDVVMENGVPDKGRVLNQLSAFWFERLRGVCPNHLITVDDQKIAESVSFLSPELRGRSALAKKAKPLSIECVARGYITGSLFKEYVASGGRVHDLNLPRGLMDGSALPEPIFTPATKAESGHDENISFGQAADRVGKETAELAMRWTLELFRLAQQHASECGLILADTKFEFGHTNEGLIWIDEALTPDSSRYWEADQWTPGKPQPSYDKQFVRDYLESIGWNKQPPGPRLPDEIIAKTRAKYLEAYRLLTGHELPA
jgi:phosphoribosylaminoimidazole-succinocarboxamide synthase